MLILPSWALRPLRAPTRRLSLALPAVVALCAAAPALAQSAADLQAIRREMDAMRQRYDAQYQTLKRDYETRLADLERRLAAAEKTAADAATATAASPVAAVAAPGGAPPGAVVTADAAPPPAAPAGNAAQSVSAFNPAIGVILDGTYANYGRNRQTFSAPGFAVGGDANLPRRGFGINESELNLNANVDQAVFGNLTVAMHPDNTASVEEAFIQTTSLPYGFTVKGGRFFSGIGYLNEQHAHVWDFVDAPLPYKTFLNNQLGDDGIQVRWVAPTPLFVELGAEGLRGDAFPASGAANAGVGQYSGFVHVGGDIDDSSSYRVGFSYLRSEARDRTTGPGDIFTGTGGLKIVDAVYKWAPDGNPTQRNFKLQGEFLWRDESGHFNLQPYKGTGYGLYAQAVYQFMPRWRVGYRYDQVKSLSVSSGFTGTTLDSGGITSFRNSLMTDYSTSEFGRYRLTLIRDDSLPKTDNQIFLQYTVSLGSHGAHQF
jgi:hypothetical protein